MYKFSILLKKNLKYTYAFVETEAIEAYDTGPTSTAGNLCGFIDQTYRVSSLVSCTRILSFIMVG